MRTRAFVRLLTFLCFPQLYCAGADSILFPHCIVYGTEILNICVIISVFEPSAITCKFTSRRQKERFLTGRVSCLFAGQFKVNYDRRSVGQSLLVSDSNL
jgi:hypothetical protein